MTGKVAFDVSRNVYIPSIEMDGDKTMNKSVMFYRKSELKRIRAEVHAMASLLDNNDNDVQHTGHDIIVDGDITESIRGIEAFTNAGQSKRLRSRRRSREAVLEEQERLRLDVDDNDYDVKAELLAEAVRSMTFTCTIRAQQLAERDAEDAMNILKGMPSDYGACCLTEDGYVVAADVKKLRRRSSVETVSTAASSDCLEDDASDEFSSHCDDDSVALASGKNFFGSGKKIISFGRRAFGVSR